MYESLPLIFKTLFSRKFQLGILFTIGFLIVTITIARLPQNTKQSTQQISRTAWASAELFLSAIVANAPILYGYCKRREQAKLPVAHSRWSQPSGRAYPRGTVDDSDTNDLVTLEPLSGQNSASRHYELFENDFEESPGRVNPTGV